MTKDSCARHHTREATHVVMVKTEQHGTHVFRLCDECSAPYPQAAPLPNRVDVPQRKATAA